MLGVDAALDGVAANFELRGQNGVQPLSGGDAQLRLHDVHAGDGLGDGVLHLDAGVHLDEVELAVLVHQEFDRAGVLVADLGGSGRGAADLLAHLGVTWRLGALR
jgi:hypothetical protein